MKHEIDEKPKGVVKKIGGVLLKLIVIAVLLIGAVFILRIAPNYIRNEITDKTNLVINFSNVTGKTKQEVLIEDDVIYLSFDDIKNYYDDNIYYDEEYNQIVTSTETKLAVLGIDENEILVNGEITRIDNSAKVENDIFYIPISEMEDIYNIKVTKVENKVIIESLDKKLTTAIADKNLHIRYKATVFSKSIEKINEGDKLVIAEVEENTLPEGWVKVRSQNGNIGYVEEKKLRDIKVEREEEKYENRIDGKVSLVWEYFSKYATAPDNTGEKYDGVNVVSPSFFNLDLKDTEIENVTKMDVVSQAKLVENVGDEGVDYINWAKHNGYKVWPKVTNDTLSSTIDEFSVIINDYELRESIINDILNYVKRYDLDGINLDFEYMYKDDSEAFSRFVIELAPQLRDIGACLSVDVTAPNGSDNWSLCYNRHIIGEVADYIVFMGYDQYGTSAFGTTSGYNWVENSINNFLNGEDVPAEKIILGLPFYTRLWKTKDDEVVGKSQVVGIKNMEDSIPDNASKDWLEDLKQYFIQYEENGYVYKMWVEDEESFSLKLDLVEKYNLAGAAYWRKGFESDKIWEIVKQKFEM